VPLKQQNLLEEPGEVAEWDLIVKQAIKKLEGKIWTEIQSQTLLKKDHSAQKKTDYHIKVSDCVNNFCVAKANNCVHKFRLLDIKPGKYF
jgi:hypothetical protein